MLKIGFARQEITPLAPAELGGYAARTHLSDGIHDQLHASVCSISDGICRTLVFSCDALAIMDDQYKELRALCEMLYGESRIVAAATHDHSAPEVRRAGLVCRENLLWRKRIVAQMAALAGEAMENERPMAVRFASQQVDGVTKSRRADDLDADETLTIFAMYDEEQVCRGMIVNFACHCTVLDASNYLVTADYPAFLYQKLGEWYPDAVVLFTNGAAGNLNIGYSADASALGSNMGQLRSFDTARRKAELLADGVRSVLENALELNGELLFRRVELDLSVKENLPSVQALEKCLEEMRSEYSAASPDRQAKIDVERVYCECIRDNLKEYPVCDGHIVTEMALLLFGNHGFVTYPGELFSRIGKKVKRIFAASGYTVAVCGYANGYFGYLPTHQAHEAGGYECRTTLLAADAENEVLHIAQRLARGENDDHMH